MNGDLGKNGEGDGSRIVWFKVSVLAWTDWGKQRTREVQNPKNQGKSVFEKSLK